MTEKIKTITVDMSSAWNTASEAGLIVEALKRAGVYTPNLLYCGLNGQALKNNEVRTTGEVFCSIESDLVPNSDMDCSAIHFAYQYKNPAIAIYDPDKTKPEHGYSYTLLQPSALILVLILNN